MLEFGPPRPVCTFAGDIFGPLVLDNPTAYTGQMFGLPGTVTKSNLVELLGIAF